MIPLDIEYYFLYVTTVCCIRSRSTDTAPASYHLSRPPPESNDSSPEAEPEPPRAPEAEPEASRPSQA
jgi:hypothetical protein